MQYTVRNVPEGLDAMLRRRAKDENKPLNDVVVEALMRAMGIAGTPVKQRDLGDIAGSWVVDLETEAALEEQRVVDPGMWE